MGAKLDTILNFWLLVDAGRWDELAQMVTPDVEFKNRGTVVGGLAAIRPYWEDTRKAFPDLRREILGFIETSDALAFEGRVTGTNTGPLTATTGQQIPATGRVVTFESIDLIRFTGNQIKSWHDEHDQLGMMVQLGILGG
jgi:predicted ester cyclase